MRTATCETCGGAVPYTRERCGNGYRVKARCRACNKPAETTAEGKPRAWYQLSAFQLHELEAMPFDGEQVQRKCGFCGEQGALEEHHLFPREWYGHDCAKGPTIDLCGKCHATWHDRAEQFSMQAALRRLKREGRHDLAGVLGRTYDLLYNRPRSAPKDTRTLPLAPPVSPQLVEAIERARKALGGE